MSKTKICEIRKQTWHVDQVSERSCDDGEDVGHVRWCRGFGFFREMKAEEKRSRWCVVVRYEI